LLAIGEKKIFITLLCKHVVIAAPELLKLNPAIDEGLWLRCFPKSFCCCARRTPRKGKEKKRRKTP